MKIIIDRFEGDIAVLLDGTELCRELLPENSREGDVLDNTSGKWERDSEKTLIFRSLVSDLIEKLWE